MVQPLPGHWWVCSSPSLSCLTCIAGAGEGTGARVHGPSHPHHCLLCPIGVPKESLARTVTLSVPRAPPTHTPRPGCQRGMAGLRLPLPTRRNATHPPKPGVCSPLGNSTATRAGQPAASLGLELTFTAKLTSQTGPVPSSALSLLLFQGPKGPPGPKVSAPHSLPLPQAWAVESGSDPTS